MEEVPSCKYRMILRLDTSEVLFARGEPFLIQILSTVNVMHNLDDNFPIH